MKKQKIHISSGRGPAECMWVVAKVLSLLLKEARNEWFVAEVINRVEGDVNGTLVSATVLIEGHDVDRFAKEWTGSILWIGQSHYRKNHKRKNWFIEVFSEEDQNETKLNLRDIEFKATKSSGPGGQHVNKTSSAVRATHVALGLSVLVQDSRSQHQNKKIAIERLQELYGQKCKDALIKDEANLWKKGIQVQRGNPCRVYEGREFKRGEK